MMRAAIKVAGALRAETDCEGINLILSDGQAAGQDVFHVHLHVKPRWNGDDVTLAWNTETKHHNDREKLAKSLRTRLFDSA
jgi:histidine triad (HIT) family protein